MHHHIYFKFNNMKQIIATILVIIGFVLSFYIGKQSCNTNVNTYSDTTVFYDTSIHYIDSVKFTYVTTYYEDTIPVFDTQVVIQEYFASKVYDRVFDDSNIMINIHDSVNKNTLFPGKLNYVWKQPMTSVVNNTTINNKYILVGGTVPFKDLSWVSLDAILVKPNISYGISYIPMQKGVSVSLYKTFKINK